MPDMGLVINEGEAKVIKQMFDWYTEHKWGTHKITKMLNLQGVPTKTGIQWSIGVVANPLVCGQLRLKDEGRVVEGQQEAIITRETIRNCPGDFGRPKETPQPQPTEQIPVEWPGSLW